MLFRSRPVHELVQAAEPPDGLVSWPQEKMIGVTQDDFGVEIVRQVTRQQTLNRSLRPNGHEDRGFDIAMSSVQDARARAGFRTRRLKFEGEH